MTRSLPLALPGTPVDHRAGPVQAEWSALPFAACARTRAT